MDIKQYTYNYLKKYRNFKDYWNYEDGCILSGCINLYRATGDAVYRDFVLHYLNPLISDDGVILNFDTGKHSTDSFNSGKSLFFAYDCTGNEKYRLAAVWLLGRLENYPRTAEGNYIHKSVYPDQIWLDGLYMVQPFRAMCINRLGCGDFHDIEKQFRNVRKLMFSPEKRLYYHAYDSARIQPWADKDTGTSPSFWLRSSGWYVMALADTYEESAEHNEPLSEYLSSLLSEALDGLFRYEDETTGLFCQVTDRMHESGNYAETSGSLMIAYAVMKGIRLGIPGLEKYRGKGERIFESILRDKFIMTDEGTVLSDICSSAGLGPGEKRNGSAEYYYSEKIVSDDPKGTGAFMMAYSEILRGSGRENSL